MPRWVRSLVRPWQSSLQLRVVTSTIVLGVVAVWLIGTYLLQAVADGLQEDRVHSAEVEARSLAAGAQAAFDNTDQSGSAESLNLFATSTVTQTLASPAIETGRYVVFMRALDNTSPIVLDTIATPGLPSSVIPRQLQKEVDAEPSRQRTSMIELDRSSPDLPIPPDGRTVIPAVVVGSQIQVPTANEYDVFFIYPVDREQTTLNLVRRLFLLGGLSLVTLVGSIAWLVTRQVVRPVRRAAAVAERLSNGNLNERMSSKGRDDLALLGKSFNDMADHLQSQIRQLEDLSRVQQVFVSDVSHELRTPLTTIRMAADVIHDRRGELASDLGRSAELLGTELDRFELLLADLLEISRFDAGAAALEADPADLVPIVKRVVSATEPLAVRRGSTVAVRGPKRGAVAEIDQRRVERVLRNLVVNAIEHGEGSPITVTVAQNATAVAVTVRDHGVGLRPGEASLVFNRFWRADPARARTTGGTGLGLAISLEDARLHDGWLQAWGEPGKGSVFRLTLPNTAGVPIGDSPLSLAPVDNIEATDADATTKLRPYRSPVPRS